MIKKGSQVKLHYTLTVDDHVIDSSRDRDPITYEHGDGQIMPGLEEQLEGMAVGDQKTATVTPDKGYGERRPDSLTKVDRSAFEDPDGLERGDAVSGEAQGKPFEATVADLDNEEVTLDLNHPLAGKTLLFDVEILEIV